MNYWEFIFFDVVKVHIEMFEYFFNQ